MKTVPAFISYAWIETLSDDDIVDIEQRLYGAFSELERREKKARGDEYELCRGSAELMAAWDCWSRLSTATRERSLIPRRAAT